MIKRTLITLGAGLCFLFSCSPAGPEQPKQISKSGLDAAGPYFSKDNKGNTVLCWTEQDGQDSLFRLKYAVYNSDHHTFGEPVTVPASAGSSNSAESMGKVLFKGDGTVVAIFGKRFPKEKNPFAGAIYYSLSSDAGKSWSAAQFLHSDTSHAYGRSFFDVDVLKDGELAAVWLDGRYGKSIKGSALFFARTTKGKGFGSDTCLEKGTCECCRTDLLTDQQGNLHLAYRNISYPSVFSDKQVRDMVYKVSTDQGKTFSVPKGISNDNWEITGCPHSGPSLAVTKRGVQALWFTAGGGPGLYYTSASDRNGNFEKRNLISAEGRHPQMIALDDDKTAMVFEQSTAAEPAHEMKMDHTKGGMKMSHAPAASAGIVMKIRTAGTDEKSIALTDGKTADHHAVIAKQGHTILVAWVREEHAQSKVYYTAVNGLND